MAEITKQREKLMKYIDNNATTYIWDEDEPITVYRNDKEAFL
jgi:hypothetical protein